MKVKKQKIIQLKDIIWLGLFILSIIASLILSKESVFNKIENFIPKLSDLLEFSLPILLAILPIAIALATFIYQIFYNRYTLKDFKYAVKSEFIWLTSILCLELLFTFIFWITKQENVFLYFEVIFLLIFSIIKFSIFLLKYNKFSIEGYVKKYTQKSIELFSKKNITIDQIKNLMQDINEYFTESLEKKENNYIRQIINAKHTIFRAYLKNISNLLLEETIEPKDDNDISHFLSESIVRDFKYLNDNNSSKKIMSIYTNNTIKTLAETILCNRLDLYKKIIDELIKCFHYTNKNDFPLNYFIEVFEEIYESQINNTDRKFNEYLETEIISLFISIIHESENSEIEQRILLANGRILLLAADNYSEEVFKKIYESFITKISYSLKYFNQKDSEILTGIVATLSKNIEEEKNNQKFNFVISNLINLIDACFKWKNEQCLVYVGALFIKNLDSELYITDNNIEDTRIKILLRCIRFYPEDSMIFLPDYKKLIENKKRNLQDIKKIQEQFSSMFQILLNSNKYDVISFYFDFLNESIYGLNKDDKDALAMFINLYENILIRSIRSHGSTKFDLAMSNFEELLEYLDNEKKISSNLLEIIFNLFDRVGSNLLDTDYFALQSFFLETLRLLPENLKSIKEQKEKQRIIEIIFHLTIGTLESKNEKSLKICSNAIGWYAVSMEKKGDYDTYKDTVDIAIHMYNLAVDQNYPKSIIAFIGTLFIVLGAYSISQKKIGYAEYVKTKIETLKDKETLKISKDLRYFESKYWDKEFNGKAKESISKFYSQITT